VSTTSVAANNCLATFSNHWSDLLSKRLVVVLREPKSWEFRHRVTALNQREEEAFYVELE
jgi:hypothetical protein